jgi:hypothetical protein
MGRALNVLNANLNSSNDKHGRAGPNTVKGGRMGRRRALPPTPRRGCPEGGEGDEGKIDVNIRQTLPSEGSRGAAGTETPYFSTEARMPCVGVRGIRAKSTPPSDRRRL